MSKVHIIEEYKIDQVELIELLKERFNLKYEHNWKYDVYFDSTPDSPLVLHRDATEELK